MRERKTMLLRELNKTAKIAVSINNGKMEEFQIEEVGTNKAQNLDYCMSKITKIVEKMLGW